MKSIRNRVQLLGLVGRVLGIRESKHHKKIAILSLVTSERYTNRDGEQILETNSHYLVTTGNIAESVEKRVRMGSELIVEGRLVYRKKADGKSFLPRIEVHEMMILSRKKDTETVS